MDEIQIALFEVRSVSEASLIDSSSQTDVSLFQIRKTPSEYVSYINRYIKEYELIKHINSRSYQIDTFVNKNSSYLNSDIQSCKKSITSYSKNVKNNQEFPNFYIGPHTNYSLPALGSSGVKSDLFKIPVNNKNSVYKPDFNNKNYFISQEEILPANEYSTVAHSSNFKSTNYNMFYPENKDDLFRARQSTSLRIPRYNFVSNGISETVAMALMVGVNTLVEIIASIAINFCPKIPDKDETLPGTGCVLMDYFNNKLDFLINDNISNLERFKPESIQNEDDHNSQDENDWVEKKIDEITTLVNNRSQTVRNIMEEIILKNCYHKSENRFDPVRYSEETPFSLPLRNNWKGPIKDGFPNNR
ncbi:hypothetical protein FG386_000853 [Cryptosporidium ryanae]|uniref:uncharacterized protein n=1 Tax=Cryptosporidium ryanae TaxID=515981 RepID=UPI00351A9EE5|nr:hypothetical protein FG386_000853 [Cryptosporidium ryanae]